MRFDRETLAWAIVLASFAVFCLTCVAAFVGGRWYLLNATEPQQAVLKVTVGTVMVRESGKPESEWLLAKPETPLKEGYSIQTVRASQALISLFDQSTITLLPESELTFSTLRLSRFSLLAPVRSHIETIQKAGKALIGVAPSGQGSTHFEIGVPQGFVSLSEGNYTLDVNSTRARVRVQDGAGATVTAQEKTVAVARGQRIETYAGEPPRPPQPAVVELITNGDFSSGLNGWKVDDVPGFPEGTDISGTVQITQGGGSPVIRFLRTGSKGTHNETYIAQEINEDISDLTKLQLTLDFKLVKQNVSGGGYMGSEYPLLVRVHYRSDQGETYIIKGFYYQNDANNRTDNGIAEPHDTWITWTLPENLMTIVPVPRKIISIELAASGHDYTSEVRRISLSGE